VIEYRADSVKHATSPSRRAARSKLSSHFNYKFSQPHPNIKIVQSLRRFISPVVIIRPRHFAFGTFRLIGAPSLLFETNEA
jgi:hypothetical protein